MLIRRLRSWLALRLKLDFERGTSSMPLAMREFPSLSSRGFALPLKTLPSVELPTRGISPDALLTFKSWVTDETRFPAGGGKPSDDGPGRT